MTRLKRRLLWLLLVHACALCSLSPLLGDAIMLASRTMVRWDTRFNCGR